MASAQPISAGRKLFKQFDSELIVAFAECEQCAARREADFSCRLPVPCRRRLHTSQCIFETPSVRPLTATDECEHRVNIVEAAEAVVNVRSPRVGEFTPAVPRFSAEQLNAPEERRGVDQVCNFRRTGGAHPAVVQGEGTVTIPQRKMEQSQMPPAVHGDHRIRLPLVPVLA